MLRRRPGRGGTGDGDGSTCAENFIGSGGDGGGGESGAAGAGGTDDAAKSSSGEEDSRPARNEDSSDGGGGESQGKGKGGVAARGSKVEYFCINDDGDIPVVVPPGVMPGSPDDGAGAGKAVGPEDAAPVAPPVLDDDAFWPCRQWMHHTWAALEGAFGFGSAHDPKTALLKVLQNRQSSDIVVQYAPSGQEVMVEVIVPEQLASQDPIEVAEELYQRLGPANPGPASDADKALTFGVCIPEVPASEKGTLIIGSSILPLSVGSITLGVPATKLVRWLALPRNSARGETRWKFQGISCDCFTFTILVNVIAAFLAIATYRYRSAEGARALTSQVLEEQLALRLQSIPAQEGSPVYDQYREYYMDEYRSLLTEVSQQQQFTWFPRAEWQTIFQGISLGCWLLILLPPVSHVIQSSLPDSWFQRFKDEVVAVCLGWKQTPRCLPADDGASDVAGGKGKDRTGTKQPATIRESSAPRTPRLQTAAAADSGAGAGVEHQRSESPSESADVTRKTSPVGPQRRKGSRSGTIPRTGSDGAGEVASPKRSVVSSIAPITPPAAPVSESLFATCLDRQLLPWLMQGPAAEVRQAQQQQQQQQPLIDYGASPLRQKLQRKIAARERASGDKVSETAVVEAPSCAAADAAGGAAAAVAQKRAEVSLEDLEVEELLRELEDKPAKSSSKKKRAGQEKQRQSAQGGAAQKKVATEAQAAASDAAPAAVPQHFSMTPRTTSGASAVATEAAASTSAVPAAGSSEASGEQPWTQQRQQQRQEPEYSSCGAGAMASADSAAGTGMASLPEDAGAADEAVVARSSPGVHASAKDRPSTEPAAKAGKKSKQKSGGRSDTAKSAAVAPTPAVGCVNAKAPAAAGAAALASVAAGEAGSKAGGSGGRSVASGSGHANTHDGPCSCGDEAGAAKSPAATTNGGQAAQASDPGRNATPVKSPPSKSPVADSDGGQLAQAGDAGKNATSAKAPAGASASPAADSDGRLFAQASDSGKNVTSMKTPPSKAAATASSPSASTAPLPCGAAASGSKAVHRAGKKKRPEAKPSKPAPKPEVPVSDSTVACASVAPQQLEDIPDDFIGDSELGGAWEVASHKARMKIGVKGAGAGAEDAVAFHTPRGAASVTGGAEATDGIAAIGGRSPRGGATSATAPAAGSNAADAAPASSTDAGALKNSRAPSTPTRTPRTSTAAAPSGGAGVLADRGASSGNDAAAGAAVALTSANALDDPSTGSSAPRTPAGPAGPAASGPAAAASAGHRSPVSNRTKARSAPGKMDYAQLVAKWAKEKPLDDKHGVPALGSSAVRAAAATTAAAANTGSGKASGTTEWPEFPQQGNRLLSTGGSTLGGAGAPEFVPVAMLQQSLGGGSGTSEEEPRGRRRRDRDKRKQRAAGVPSDPTPPDGSPDWITTVMISGIPSEYTPHAFKEQLDMWGLLGCYNLFLMPADNPTGLGLGHALVNFIDPAFAMLCQWLLAMLQFQGAAAPAEAQGVEACIQLAGVYAADKNMIAPVAIISEPVPSQWAVNATNELLSPQYRGQFRKTKICSFYKKGRCTMCTTCPFAHSPKELQQLPDLSHTKLCYAYFRGRCMDDKCKYAHGSHNLRSVKALEQEEAAVWTFDPTMWATTVEGTGWPMMGGEFHPTPEALLSVLNGSFFFMEQDSEQDGSEECTSALGGDSSEPRGFGLNPGLVRSPRSVNGGRRPTAHSGEVVEGIRARGTFMEALQVMDAEPVDSMRRSWSDSDLPAFRAAMEDMDLV